MNERFYRPEEMAVFAGRHPKRTKIALNTYLESGNPKRHFWVEFHSTRIVQWKQRRATGEWELTLNTGGHFTKTTFERMTRYIPRSVQIFSDKKKWVVRASLPAGPGRLAPVYNVLACDRHYFFQDNMWMYFKRQDSTQIIGVQGGGAHPSTEEHRKNVLTLLTTKVRPLLDMFIAIVQDTSIPPESALDKLNALGGVSEEDQVFIDMLFEKVKYYTDMSDTLCLQVEDATAQLDAISEQNACTMEQLNILRSKITLQEDVKETNLLSEEGLDMW